MFNLIDTLLSPILSDSFGFTVDDISYFLLVSMLLPLIATVLLYAIIIIMKLNNYVLLVL